MSIVSKIAISSQRSETCLLAVKYAKVCVYESDNLYNLENSKTPIPTNTNAASSSAYQTWGPRGMLPYLIALAIESMLNF